MLNDKFLCLYKVSIIAFWLESAHEKQCPGKGVYVVSGRMTQKINMGASSVQDLYSKNIVLGYPSNFSQCSVNHRIKE